MSYFFPSDFKLNLYWKLNLGKYLPWVQLSENTPVSHSPIMFTTLPSTVLIFLLKKLTAQSFQGKQNTSSSPSSASTRSATKGHCEQKPIEEQLIH